MSDYDAPRWQRFDTKNLRLNNDRILDNIKVNIQRQLPQVRPYPPQTQPVCVVGGGPSLRRTLTGLRQRANRSEHSGAPGDPVIAVNGSADWLMDRGITPVAHVLLDSREFNARFVRREIPNCRYFIASQCHPAVFDTLEQRGSRIWIWHASISIGEDEILDEYYLSPDNYIRIVGGCTVMLRAIWLLRTLGFIHQHIYGMDSCLDVKRNEHHAYEQTENDHDDVIRIRCAGEVFYCSSWMASQAVDFMEMMKHLGANFRLRIHGRGLISHIVEAAAARRLIEITEVDNDGSISLDSIRHGA